MSTASRRGGTAVYQPRRYSADPQCTRTTGCPIHSPAYAMGTRSTMTVTTGCPRPRPYAGQHRAEDAAERQGHRASACPGVTR